MQGFSSGMLRHRGTFQKSVTTTNAQGQSVVDWETVAARIPVRVGGDGKQEVIRAFSQQQQSDMVHEVRLRWTPNIGNGMRFIWHDGTQDRTMSIAARPLNPDGKHKWMVLVCKEPL